jgi:hypothetical protein
MKLARPLLRSAGLVFVVAAATASRCPGSPPEPPPGPPAAKQAHPLTLRITIDGGYFFDLEDKRIDVVNAGSNHQNYLKVFDDSKSRQELVEVKDGQTLRVTLDGKPPADIKPGFPSNNGATDGCVETEDQKHVNSSRFIPDLSALAERMGTHASPPETAGRMSLTGGGEVRVRELGGCVEFRDPKVQAGKWVRRSMASGREGIVYEWSGIAATEIALVLSGGASATVPLKPDANGLIVLHAKSEAYSLIDSSRGEHEIKHFWDHFEGAFGPVSGPKRILLWWKKAYIFDANKSPGIDCPPGSAQP